MVLPQSTANISTQQRSWQETQWSDADRHQKQPSVWNCK